MNKVNKIFSVIWSPFRWILTGGLVVISAIIFVLYIIILVICAGLESLFGTIKSAMLAFIIGLFQGMEKSYSTKKKKTEAMPTTSDSKTVH